MINFSEFEKEASSFLKAEGNKRNESVADEVLKEMPDETADLFKRIVAKRSADEGMDKTTLDLFEKTNSALIKEIYSNEFKSSLKELAESGVSKQNLLDEWHKQLAMSAKQMGAIEKYDDKTLKMFLKEQTYEPEFEKYSVWDGLKLGFKNQIEGIQYAGIAAAAALKGDKDYYLEKAGGEMALYKDEYKWSDVLTDLLFMGNTGSETGGKMFAADLLFLPTSPIKVPLRIATVGVGKSVLTTTAKTAAKAGAKGASKTITKTAVKGLTRETVEEMIKGGAKIELKGVGAKILEKDITKMATEMTKTQLKEAGKTAIKKLPTDLINQNKAKIIMDGLSSSQKTQTALKNLTLGSLDLINVPIGLNTRELVKGMMGYGIPVLSGVSEGVQNVSSYFTQTGNKLAQLYAQHNVTQYEKQLAKDFIEMTGADPLAEDFAAKEQWEAYKNFKIRNEGMATIVMGQKEGWGKFWNFFAESAVNMMSMMAGVKGVTKTLDVAGNKLSLTTTADLTKKINELKNSDRFSGKLELDIAKEDIDAFVKEVEALDFKKGAVEDVKLLNRANQLVEAIFKKSTGLTLNNPVLANKIAALAQDLKKNRDFEYSDVKDRYKQIAQIGKEIVGELEVNNDRVHFFRENAELKKIVDYFKDLEEKDTFATRLRLSVARNIARGSSEDVRTFMGGISTAEAFASRNLFLADYFLNRTLSASEMAKNVAFQKELDMKNIQFLKELTNLQDGKLAESGFMRKITDAVSSMVNSQFKDFDPKSNSIITKSVINEGITKVLEVYNTLSTKQLYPEVGGTHIDFGKFAETILGETFGTDILNTVASKKNVTVSKFLKSSDAKDGSVLANLIRDSFKNPDNIFNPKSEQVRVITEKYRSVSETARENLRKLAQTQKNLADKFHLDLMELDVIKEKRKQIKILGFVPPTRTKDGHLYDGRVFKTEAGANNRAVSDIKKLAYDYNKQALNDPNFSKNLFTADDIEAFTRDNFKGLRDSENALKQMLTNNIDNIQDSVLKIFEQNNPESVKRSEFNVQEEKSEDGEEPINTANRALNKYIDELRKLAPMIGDKFIINSEPKMSDLVRLSKITNEFRATALKIESNKNLEGKIGVLNEEITKLKSKIATAKTLKEKSSASIEMINKILPELEKELSDKTLKDGEVDLLKERIIRLESNRDSLMRVTASTMGRSEQAELNAYKEIIDNEVKHLDKNITAIEKLTDVLSREIEAKRKELGVSANIDESITKLQSKLALFWKEQDKLLGERDTIVSEMFKDPLGKESLSAIAKEVDSVDAFYGRLKDQWSKSFGIKFPEELANPESRNYKAIYNTLKQTVYEYKNPEFAGPIENMVLNVQLESSKKGDNVYSFGTTFGVTDARLANGSKIPNGIVESKLHKLADEKGYKLVEMKNMQYGGKDKSPGDLFTFDVSNAELMETWSKETPKIQTPQEAVYYQVAKNISKKIHIAVGTNRIEMLVAAGSSPFKIKTKKGDGTYVVGEKLLKRGAEVSQASTDGEINKAATNMIYHKFVKPLADEALSKGQVMLGSLNEEGKRIFFTPIKNNDAKGTFESFYKEVASLDPKKLVKVPDPLKRIKNMAGSEIHMDIKTVNDSYKAAKLERNLDENGNVMFRGIVIDDETTNKISLEIAGEKREFVTTDGTLYYSPFFMELLQKEIGLKDDLVTKSFAYVPGDKGFVLKFMGKKLDQAEANKSYFNSVENAAGTREINQLGHKYDLFVTKSTLKSLGYDYKEGDIIDIPVDTFRTKRLDNTLKDEVSGAMQFINSIPRILSGNPKWTELYDKATDSILKVYDGEIKEFASVLQKINLDKPGAVDTLINSPLFKDITGDDYMSKAINDIRANGGLKDSNKSVFFNHIMKIFRDRIVRLKLKGSEAHIIGTGDYQKLADTVVNKYKDQGVTYKNFIILNPDFYKDKVYYNKEGLPEVFTYRYPVNKPSNMTVAKVIWSNDPDVYKLTGDIGNKALLNMYDVFINKEGDFDIDKINIVSDPRLNGDFLNLIREIPNQKELNFNVDIKGKVVEFHDIELNAINPTSDKLPDSVNGELRKGIQEKVDYFSYLYKIKSKYSDFSLNSLAEFLVEARDRIRQEKNLTENASTGMSFIERFINLPTWGEIEWGNIKINRNVEREATSYANKKINEAITNKSIENNPVASKFDELNKEFAKKLGPIQETLQAIDAKEYSNDYKKVKIIVKDNGTSVTKNYKKNKINIDYHRNVQEKLTSDLENERKRIFGLPRDKRGPEWKNYYFQKNVKIAIDRNINDMEEGRSNLVRAKRGIFEKFEQEAIRTIKPDLTKGDSALDLQRYILSQTWGSVGDIKSHNGKAFFLVSPEIHKEYNSFYNERYLSMDLKESFGLRIEEADTQKIKIAYDNFTEISKNETDPIKIAEAKKELTDIVYQTVSEKISTVRPTDRLLKITDVSKLGRFSQFFSDLMSSKTSKAGYGQLSLNDVYTIKDLSDNIMKTTPDNVLPLVKNIDQNKKAVTQLSNRISSLWVKKYKEKNVSKQIEIGEAIELTKQEMVIKISEILVGSYAESLAKFKTESAIADLSLKSDLIKDGDIKDQERKVKNSEYKLNEANKLAEETKDVLLEADIINLLTNHKDLYDEYVLLEARLGSEEAKMRLYEKMAEKLKVKTEKAFANLFVRTTDKVIRADVNSLLNKYDGMKEMEKFAIETRNEIAKMEEIQPSDFLSQLFETTTKTYKSLAVGIMYGRALIESVNSGLVLFAKATEKLHNGRIDNKYIKEKYGSTPNFKIPESKFKGNVYEEFIMKNLGDSSPTKRNRVLKNFNDTMTRIAGTISNKFVNVIPAKMAERYYQMEFTEALYKEVSKNDGTHRQKLYMLQDPSKLSWQDRQQYSSTLRYLEETARKETEKAFFNYDMNPLIVHKMESAFPFSNFMVSGFRLMAKHPKSILGANILFNSIINNYGEQVGFIMDDEDGDPVRVDYGKKLKLPMLGIYGGVSFNLDRLLQFSPSDTRVGMAPIFSYLSGDFDWRVKAWRDGEMSGLELVAGAISPSIGQLATGIYEQDYQKKFSAMSYMFTGLAGKSSAHSKIANDFYIKQDYSAVKNAPDDVKKHLFDQYNNKNKDSKLDDSVLDANIKAQELGLLGEPTKRNSLGVYEKKDAWKDAIRINGQMITLAAEGKTDPLYNEDYYKKHGRDIAELSKWVMGSDFFEKAEEGGFDEWLKDVEEFVKDGHLDNFEKANKPLGSAMRHYYENRKYYSKIYEAQGIAYSANSTQEEKLKASAELIALKYELVGAGETLDQKVNALINGQVQFIVDENGMPEMTKERKEEISYRGFYVENYENTISKHLMERDTRSFYLTMAFKAKENGDKKTESYAFNMADHYKSLMTESYKQLQEHHTETAKVFNLRRIERGQTPAEMAAKGLSLTAPVQNFAQARFSTLNDFYNELATNQINFLNQTDVKWSSLSNKEKTVFMAMNNGKTINQAREELAREKDFFEGLVDVNAPKRTSNNIKLIKDTLYE